MSYPARSPAMWPCHSATKRWGLIPLALSLERILSSVTCLQPIEYRGRRCCMISEARNAHSSPERGSASIAAMCTCVQRYHQLHNPCGQTPSLVPVCVVAVQSLSHVQLFVTPWAAAHQASLSLTISWSSPKFMSIGSVILPNHALCHPLLILPSILSQPQGLFQ